MKQLVGSVEDEVPLMRVLFYNNMDTIIRLYFYMSIHGQNTI